MPTGADWLLDALAAEGVRYLVGNPGSTELPLIEALAGHCDVRYVLALHESVAMGIADGYAQQTGRLAAVNVHVQPGMANALSGVLNARKARVPLLVTVGQQVSSLLPTAPFLGGDVTGMAESVAKAAFEPQSPSQLVDMTERAIRIALAEPQGPVVLSVPLDVQAAPAPATHRAVAPLPAPAPAPDAVAAAARALSTSDRPVVLVGDAVGDSGAGAQLAAIAERIGAPMWGEPMPGRISIPTDHPLYRRPLPPFGSEIAPILADHDLVLACGMPVFRLFGTSPASPLPSATRLIHIDTDPDEVGRSHEADVGIVADLPSTLLAIAELLAPSDEASRARCRQAVEVTARERRLARSALASEAAGSAITPAGFSLAIAAAVGPRDLVVDEGLTAGRGLRAAIGRRTRGTWLAHRGSALGWGLPAAVGAKLAEPWRRVMAIQGDGSLMFGAQALWTAAREGLGVGLVVADNRGYEILRAGMEGLTGRSEAGWPGLALDQPEIDVATLCGAYGASTATVLERADLAAALDDLWRRTEQGPAALVVRVTGRTPPVGYPI